MLQGFTDWHSHILPGVDDGIPTMDESLSTLASLEEQGVRKVWLTPHVMEDCPNTTGRLRERFAELREQYKGPIELALASENMLDALFEERLRDRDFRPARASGALPLHVGGRLPQVEGTRRDVPVQFHLACRRIWRDGSQEARMDAQGGHGESHRLRRAPQIRVRPHHTEESKEFLVAQEPRRPRPQPGNSIT